MQWHQLDHMQTICTSLQTDNHTNTSLIAQVLQVGCSSSINALEASASAYPTSGTAEKTADTCLKWRAVECLAFLIYSGFCDCCNLSVGCYDGKVYVIDRRLNGLVVWSFQTGGQVKSSACINPRSGYAYIGSHDHHLYAFDIQVTQCWL